MSCRSRRSLKMVSLNEMKSIALKAYRDTGTEISRAFLKALGLDVPALPPKHSAIVSVERYSDIEKCFRNRRSAEDARAFAGAFAR